MNDADLAKVLDPATLPNGRLLPNRLVKVSSELFNLSHSYAHISNLCSRLQRMST